MIENNNDPSPSDLCCKNGEIALTLGYRPPYKWTQMLSFLDGRAIRGVDLVREEKYYRNVRLPSGNGELAFGWLCVANSPSKNELIVTLSESLLPVLSHVKLRISHMFDLSCDPDAVFEKLDVMNEIRSGLCVHGTRLPGCFDAFEMAARAVLGQQITVKAASTLATRMADTLGTRVETGIDGLTHVFPSPEDILALDGPVEEKLGKLGVIASRSRTIYELARMQSSGEINLGITADPEAEMKKLLAIRGIGSWTAQYIAMRAMQWPDSFLETDAGVKKALPDRTPKELLAIAEAWRPWRSYATMNLWNSL